MQPGFCYTNLNVKSGNVWKATAVSELGIEVLSALLIILYIVHNLSKAFSHPAIAIPGSDKVVKKESLHKF